MGAQPIRPETLEERIVYWTIVFTWALWLLGGLYMAGPVLGYLLFFIFLARFFGYMDDPVRQPLRLPIGVIVWIVGMAMMALALVIGHLDFELGIGKMIKSLVGWAKGWALFAVFPLAGAVLSIRAAVLYRATGILAVQTLILIPLLLIAGYGGLPKHLYTSPLHHLGPGPEFFDVTLYSFDVTTSSLRWRFFSPWPTAAALVASMGLFFALYERSIKLKIVGIIVALLVCWMAGSRSSIVAIPVVILGVFVMSNLHRPSMLIALALSTTALVLFSDMVLVAIEDTKNAFDAARAASSRVRDKLNSIGYHRWYSEAFWFGHGTVQPGPHLVALMPIGSHHTWYGLLFVKGVVGLLAFAVPLGWSIFELCTKAQSDRVARCALSVVLAIAMFSFADNIEIIIYQIWPALLLVGIGLRRGFRNPYIARMDARSRDVVWGNAGYHPLKA